MLLSEIIAQNLVTLKYIYLLNFDKKKSNFFNKENADKDARKSYNNR